MASGRSLNPSPPLKNWTDRELALWRNQHGENVPVPPERKKRDNTESKTQCALLDWWRLSCRGFGVPECLLFSVPNGGRRDPIGMVFLKREGLRKGAPDLLLLVRRRDYGALAIEMKTPTGRLSAEQEQFHRILRAWGYCVAVCRSLDEATKVITDYLTP